MKTWWLALNSREQRLIGSLAGVVSLFIFYSFVWQPLNENIEKGQKKLTRQQELLTFVSSETQRYKAEKKSGNNQASSGSLSSIVNRSAKQQAITITRIQPQSNSVQVWIDNIAFSQLLVWLEQLANKEGIQVETIDLTKGEQPGQVRVKRLQLGKV
ncbi:MAG: type II secretion system protein M [Thalassotalea sp.]|nr:type II secretion system protein M [Thalassotalea sp.]